MGVSEVAGRLDIPRSSAHALLASLADIGLLQWRDGGRYQIGWRVFELAEVRRGMLDVRAAAEPVLQRLQRTHGETCHLAVRDRCSVLYIDKVLGTHNITVQGARIGTRLECHCTAVGKVLLAFASDDIVDKCLSSAALTKRTARTISTAAQFRQELAEVARRGHAYDLGEAVDDVHCVAAPIRDEFGQVVAALSLSAPVTRFEKQQSLYTGAVREAALEVGRALVDSSRDHSGAGDEDYPRTVKRSDW